MFDAKFLEVLSLPAKIIGGLFAFTAVSLIIDTWLMPTLLGAWRPYFILGALLFGCLFVSQMIALTIETFKISKKPSVLAERRKVLKDERIQERFAAEKAVLKRLDHLSPDELSFVADALRAQSQSFTGWVHSGDLSNMQMKGLIITPGGEHHADYYPFSFPDFVWEEVLARRIELIEKHNENQRLAEEEEGRGPRR